MKIFISGTVQGLGIRPTVYRVAKSQGLKGYVLNKGTNVEIGIEDDGKSIKDKFLDSLLKKLPLLAVIDKIVVKDEPVVGYTNFEILTSSDGEKTSLTPVDTAICEECVDELFESDNRRYLYPFINCTSCGARFSVIENSPYDRANTSMHQFQICKACLAEYMDPMDRRFHAQTISCPRCGPRYTLYDRTGAMKEVANPIQTFAELVDGGAIGIAKGFGGMHLICKFESAKRLRELYWRPAKPFAAMFRTLDTVKKYLKVDEEEEKLLVSPHRPIVLLDKRSKSGSRSRSPSCELSDISPGLGTVGVFLPYSGLHYVLFRHLHSDAIIMTSANIPGEPMAIINEEAIKLNADYFLLHDCRIVNRVDDSVIKRYRYRHGYENEDKGRNFFLRRSRGFIPVAMKVPYNERILSLGAMENVTVSISKDGSIYMSQYIGNTAYYQTVDFLAAGTEQILRLLGLRTDAIDSIGIDLHPRYQTRRYGKILAEEFSIETVEVQHHWAHAASLMLDNGVDEVIALTLDGTGYGTDKKAWGGEILCSRYDSFERVCSLEEIPLIGGEIAVKEIKRLLFAVFSLLGRDPVAAQLFDEQEANVMRKLLPKAVGTSSFGRVLDALSYYLGICQRMTYDGEPAMRLERYLAEGTRAYEFNTDVKCRSTSTTIDTGTDREIVLTLPLFDQLAEYMSRDRDLMMDGLNAERHKADIAYSFVFSLIEKLVEIAADTCGRFGIQNIGITGGVSYNVPIVRMSEELVRERELEFLTHDNVPNGDAGISVGQNAIVGYLRKK